MPPLIKDLDQKTILAIKEIILAHTGIKFDERRTNDLARNIRSACSELNIPVHTCLDALKNSKFRPQFLDTVIKYITVGETYFFRDKSLFSYLKEVLLPTLICSRRNEQKLFLRIWSAACSSGEEPYSIAMLLRSLLVDIDDWDIYILATDINQKMLDRAREGTYSRWSFREEPIIPIGDYFVPTPDNRLKIEESVRMMVRFERQNLIQDTPYYYARPPSSLDLILCRNVLMYFSAEQSEKVVEQLARSLRLGGTLIVSPQEIGLIKSPDLTLVHKRTVFLHEKRERNAYACEEAFQTHYGEIYYIKSDASYPAGALSEPAQEERQIVSDVLSFHDTSLPSFICSTCTGPDTENRQFDQLIAENNLDEAARMISLRGMDFSPSTIKDIEILIRAYAGDGRYDQALGWVDRMIAFDMLNPRSYLLKAALLDEQGLVDQSLHVLRQSLYASRDYLPAHLAIAGIYSKIGQIDRARHYYEQAIRILESMDEDAIIEETEGIPAKKMKEMIYMVLG